MTDQKNAFVDSFKPYKGRFASYDRIPDKGRDRDDIFGELSTMSEEENAKWRNGKVSGTFYHAGAEHRAFLNRIFSLFSHVNVLQVDLCPSMSKFESEIVAMTAAMLQRRRAPVAQSRGRGLRNRYLRRQREHHDAHESLPRPGPHRKENHRTGDHSPHHRASGIPQGGRIFRHKDGPCPGQR